jgi:hypothetical protein
MNSEKLDVKVGNRIRYLEDDLWWPDENGVERIVVAHGMIGTVVMVSDGSLRQEVRKELRLPPRDVSRGTGEIQEWLPDQYHSSRQV